MVSNHGGRQLDGVEATIDALPAIVKGGSISESFSLWQKFQKIGAKSRQHLFFTFEPK